MDGPTIDLEIDLSTVPATAVMVDPEPEVEVLGWLRRMGEGTMRAVVPSWWTIPHQRALVVGSMRRYAWHRVKYHGIRLPWHLLCIAAYTIRGALRLIRDVLAWVTLAEALPLRRSAVSGGDHDAWKAEFDRAAKATRPRAYVAGAVVVGAIILAAMAWARIPDPARGPVGVLTGIGAVYGLARRGAPVGRPIIGRAVIRNEAPRITSELIVKALEACAIQGMAPVIQKNPNAVRFPAPIQRDGPGWRADVELPPGFTATQVAAKRDRLAAALARPLGCVWPEVHSEVHPGRLILWVGDQDMSIARQPAWPLLRAGTVDLFDRVPFGTDQRGKPVHVTLMFASMVCGAVPRMGKTVAVRLLATAAALDVRTELHLYDLKGTGDFGALETVSHRYRAGDDTDDLDYLIADLRELREELRRRAKVIRGLPRDTCPDNKVTSSLASQSALRLHPILLLVDECQALLTDGRVGKEAAAICEDLVRRGPALGIISIFATQRPDKESLPTGISGNAIIRFCLRVMGQVENDMVLGTSAYQNGVRATMFSRRDRGIGYLAGEGEDPQIVRAYYLDGPATEAVIARARAAREAAGRVTGYALGQTETPAPVARRDFLRDVISVTGPTERRIWTTTLLAALGEWRPEVYEGWTPDQLSAAFKPYGIAPRATHGTPPAGDTGSVTRQGYDLAAVRDAQRQTPE